MNLSRHIAAAGGWISMETFMELALYGEAEGYYSASIHEIGARGDFSTSATLSPLLARRIVAHWKEACERAGKKLPMIEVGGGNGNLAAAIGRELGFWGRLGARYYMVDRARNLRHLQLLNVGNFARVYETMERALKQAQGEAFIFSNELPDAFPARRFVFRQGSWLELGLSVEGGRYIEAARPCSVLPESAALERWAVEGQIVEVQELYASWYRSWQPLWKQGVCMTIDYGDENATLYDRRPNGTLRGYRSHKMLAPDELYASAGRCDITCDVNFTDLRRLAESCIGDTAELITQREYLLPSADSASAADAWLVSEPGPGDHFRVLIQERFS